MRRNIEFNLKLKYLQMTSNPFKSPLTLNQPTSSAAQAFSKNQQL